MKRMDIALLIAFAGFGLAMTSALFLRGQTGVVGLLLAMTAVLLGTRLILPAGYQAKSAGESVGNVLLFGIAVFMFAVAPTTRMGPTPWYVIVYYMGLGAFFMETLLSVGKRQR